MYQLKKVTIDVISEKVETAKHDQSNLSGFVENHLRHLLRVASWWVFYEKSARLTYPQFNK